MADDRSRVDGQPREKANTARVRAATQEELESDLATYGRSFGTRPLTFTTPADEIRAQIRNLEVYWQFCENSQGVIPTPDYVSDVDKIRNQYRENIGLPPSVEYIDPKIRAVKDQALDALDKVKQSLDEAAPPSETPSESTNSKRRGPKVKYDPKEDAKILDMWNRGFQGRNKIYSSYADLAEARGKDEKQSDIENAVGRARKALRDAQHKAQD